MSDSSNENNDGNSNIVTYPDPESNLDNSSQTINILSGKYRAKFIVRITFLLGGLLLLSNGSLTLYLIISDITANLKPLDAKATAYLVFHTFLSIISIIFIVKAIQDWRKKDNSFEKKSDTKFWTCDNCQEQIEEQFSECWKCSQKRSKN